MPVAAGESVHLMQTARALAESSVPARPVPAGAGGASRPIPAANRPLPAAASPGATTLRDGEPPDEESGEEVVQEIVKRAPPWAVSTVIHLVLFLVLALITWGATRPPKALVAEFTEPEPDDWSEKLGEQNNIETMLTTDKPEEQQVISDSPLPPVPDPLAAPPDNPVVEEAITATSDKKAPDPGMALNGRQRGRRGDLLAAYGGNRLTEEAVLAALEWLARNQRNDGSWSLQGPYSDGSSDENIISATSMALLAFQGHGDTHIAPDPGAFESDAKYQRALRFSKVVANGWSALLKYLEKDGKFRNECTEHQVLYAQGQATIAICEIYAMTNDKKFEEPAQRVVDYAIKIQDSAGGWRYTPGSDSDVSVSGWFMMGLQSARMGKLDVPQKTLDKLSGFLDSVAMVDGRQYRYRVNGPTTDAMTAEGLLCRQYLGWKREDPRMLGGVQFVGERPMVWADGKRNVYYWYYATQVAHHMEGEYWRKWNSVMRQMLPSNQIRKGKEDGSWDPKGDIWGDSAGRLYVTCLSTYMLEVYYRHLPIYRKFF
ncbi:MAG: squalene--hopene cyclase [Pirellulales bacterium]